MSDDWREPVEIAKGVKEDLCDLVVRFAEEINRLRRIEALAHELLTAGMRTQPGGLTVIERKDKTDPHYRLCKELGI